MSLALRLWICSMLLTQTLAAAEHTRFVPRPLSSHPGNIFLAGEGVAIPAPPATNDTWRLLDYDDTPVASGRVNQGQVDLGRLKVGYYELERGSNRVSIGVLEPLRSPTPLNSPIGLDVGMAWFYPPAKMAEVAGLCELAGVNYVRDRLLWSEMEPQRGSFSAANRNDSSALAQSAAGLRVLQVIHLSPQWANPNTKRFSLDLRDSYNFYRAMAARWKGQVCAFEPWNEADIDVFGGHAGSEMASFQKAAYLGLKAGNPEILGCLNVFALHRSSTLADLHENAAWPYFDTFNLHHYEPFNAYPQLYADFRKVSAGKPMWVTECSLPVKWSGDEQAKEPTRPDLRTQSERVAETYALSLHEGPEAVFYFLLPHYAEGQTQFGIVRSNLTPRPAFVALAAVGRLLAGAKPLGRVKCNDDSTQAYLFKARPDGQKATVVVAWSEQSGTLELPTTPLAAFDHLGRRIELPSGSAQLSRSPIYILLPQSAHFSVTPPPEKPPRLKGRASPIVFQAMIPEEKLALESSACRVRSGSEATIPFFAYNFSTKPVRGALQIRSAEGWSGKLVDPVTTNPLSQVEMLPGDRKPLSLIVQCKQGGAERDGWVRVEGDFRSAGRPIVSVRLTAGEPGK